MSPIGAEKLIAGRVALYALLARLFRTEAGPAFLDRLEALRLPAATGPRGIAEGCRLMAGFLRRHRAAAVSELAVDFARVFLCAGGRGGALPYESVYTSPERLLMQEARDAVLANYRRESLQRAADFRGPEDHVALELEFMAHMCRRTAAAMGRGERQAALACLDRQREFLNRHLLRWVPAFCRDVRRLAGTDFYRGLARFTADFLRVDRELLRGLGWRRQGLYGHRSRAGPRGPSLPLRDGGKVARGRSRMVDLPVAFDAGDTIGPPPQVR